MAQEKSWIDHVMALVLPVVVSVGGLAYTIHKDQVDEKVRNENRRADIERQEWDRDTAYVRLLTSSNPDEKKLGLAIIGQLVKQGSFPADLKPVVAVIAGGLPSDDATGIAAQLLKSAPATPPPAQPAASTNSASPTVAPAPVVARAVAVPHVAKVKVFVQIQSDAQRPAALDLQSAIRDLGFDTAPLDRASTGPNVTDIRYFSQDSADEADKLRELLTARGVKVGKPKFYKIPQPMREVEIWLGKSDLTGATAAAAVAKPPAGE